MNADPIAYIKWFIKNNRAFSFLILVHVILFAFTQNNFFQSFFFVYFLFFAGSLFLKSFGILSLYAIYVCSFVIGGFFFSLWQPITVHNLPEFLAAALQAGVFGLLTAITVFNPKYKIKLFMLVSIQLRFLTMALVLINLLSIEADKQALYVAYLGGVLAGVLAGLYIKGIFNIFLEILTKRKSRMKAEYNTQRPLSDDTYNAIRADKQKQMDMILDKISKNGYDALTKEEKEFLFKSSTN